jgi:uncharacterized C2H2 Zn-finger protein
LPQLAAIYTWIKNLKSYSRDVGKSFAFANAVFAKRCVITGVISTVDQEVLYCPLCGDVITGVKVYALTDDGYTQTRSIR